MTKSQRLIERLSKELDTTFPEGTEVRRTYAGRNQRACGAWSWFLYCEKELISSIGSSYTVTELLKAKKWSFTNDIDKTLYGYNTEVYPEEKDQ